MVESMRGRCSAMLVTPNASTNVLMGSMNGRGTSMSDAFSKLVSACVQGAWQQFREMEVAMRGSVADCTSEVCRLMPARLE